MRKRLLRLIGVLRLARVSMALGAVTNVWFVILWSRSVERATAPAELVEISEWLALGAGAVVAAGLYAFGTCLNDLLDATRDRAMRRDRPLPSGQVSVELASMALGVTALAAVLASTAFGTGSVVLTCVVALGVLLFNAVGRHIPAVGMLILSLIYAGHMLVPNSGLRFMWPVWLVMSHATVVAGVSHVIGRKRPVLSRRAMVFAAAGWAGASYALLATGRARSVGVPGFASEATLWPSWVQPWSALGPALLAAAFAALATRRVLAVGPGPRAADKVTRYGAIWPGLYGSAWLWSMGRDREALILLGASGLGLVLISVLREAYAMIEHPTGYRR